MAKFNIKAPDGRAYTVEGDNATGALAALKKMLGSDRPSGPMASTVDQLPGGATPLPTTGGMTAGQPQTTLDEPGYNQLGDTLKELPRIIPSALGQGAVGLAGLPGAIERLGQLGTEFVGRQFTGKPAETEEQLSAERLFADPGEMSDRYEKMTGVPFYKPKTPIGGAVSNVVSMLPGAVALGPEAGLAGVGSNALRYGIVPGVASEAAGDVAHAVAPDTEDAAREVAAMAAGGRQGIKDFPRATAPSVADLKAASQALYSNAKQRGIVVTPQSFVDFVDNTTGNMEGALLDKSLHPKTSAALKRLQDDYGSSPSLERIDQLRQIVGDAFGNDKGENRMAGMLSHHFDNYINKLAPSDVMAGNPIGLGDVLSQARALWSQKAKGEIIDAAVEKAKNTAANQTGNMDAALRNTFRSVANRPDFARRFTPTEQKAILDVVRASKTERAMRFLGRFAPESHPWSTAFGSSLGYAVAGPAGAAAVPIVGTLGNAAAKALTQRQANIASAIVRGGKRPGVWKGGLAAAVLAPYYANMATRSPNAGN